MKLTWSWLNTHWNTPLSLKETLRILPSLGFDAEEEACPHGFWPFQVVQITTITPHPQAERLRLCHLRTQAGPLTVVCGAENAYEGMYAILARVGDTLPGETSPLMSATIRGVVSQGMLCSFQELGLDATRFGANARGIVDLPGDIQVGMPAKEALGLQEDVFSVEVTPNRGDVLSARGLARELVAAGYGTLKPLALESTANPPIKNFKQDPRTEKGKEFCPYYTLAVLNGLDNTCRIPRTAISRLLACGFSLHNPIVDATNYTMVDLGIPLHPFDSQDMNLETWRIDTPPAGSTFIGLNHHIYTLGVKDAVVTHDNEILGLVGILGAKRGAICPKTSAIFLEAGQFSPQRISTTGQRLHIQSQARLRAERGIDGFMVQHALNHAITRILHWCGGTCDARYEAGSPQHPHPHPIATTVAFLEKRTGLTALQGQTVADIFTRLGCETTLTENTIRAAPPSWRHDLKTQWDLSEEVVRIQGIHHVVPQLLPRNVQQEQKIDAIRNLRYFFASRGLTEEVTWSFIDHAMAHAFQQEGIETLMLRNPISPSKSVLRPSILPGLLQGLVHDAKRQGSCYGTFEIGPVFSPGSLPSEHTQLAFVLSPKEKVSWASVSKSTLWDGMALLYALCKALGFSKDMIETKPCISLPHVLHPGKASAWYIGGTYVGYCGIFHPTFLKIWDTTIPYIGGELNLNVLFSLAKVNSLSLETSGIQALEADTSNHVKTYPEAYSTVPQYNRGSGAKALKKNTAIVGLYPSITRDLALCIPKDFQVGTLTTWLFHHAGPNCVDIAVFDRFTDPKTLGENHLSVAFRLTFQSAYQTLESAEVDAYLQALLGTLCTTFPEISVRVS